KSVKHLVDLFRLNANAGVRNSDLDFVSCGTERFDSNAAVLRSEFDSILDQVPKDLLQSGWIALDVRAFGAEPEVNGEIFGGYIFAANLVGALQNFRNADHRETEL